MDARYIYYVVLTRQSNPPISQFNSLCNELTIFWSMFVYNTPPQLSRYYCFTNEFSFEFLIIDWCQVKSYSLYFVYHGISLLLLLITED